MRELLFILVFLLSLLFTACNSSSAHTNAGAMPITEYNIDTYVQKISQSSQMLSTDLNNTQRAVQIYKVPLEEMGYDFDATIVHTIKVMQEAEYSDLSLTTMKILQQILSFVEKYPQNSVKDGLVSQETKKKIIAYNKFHTLENETLQALLYVEKCQNMNNGICKIDQYLQLLIDSKFISTPTPNSMLTSSYANLSTDTMLEGNFSNEVVESFSKNFFKKVDTIEMQKYLVDNNGNRITCNILLTKNTKPFKLRNGFTQELKEYTPWWN